MIERWRVRPSGPVVVVLVVLVGLGAIDALARPTGVGESPEPFWVTGRVVDRTGVPRAGVRISILGQRAPVGTTDAAGRYRLLVPGPGVYRLRAAGHQPVRVSRAFPVVRDVALPDLGGATVASFWHVASADAAQTSGAASPVTARAVDRSRGRAVPDAWVAGFGAGVRSNEEGRFRGPGPAQAWLVAARGYAAIEARAAEVDLVPASPRYGRVVDRAGRPIADARVIASPMAARAAVQPAAWTRADGRFVLDGLAPGVVVRVRAERLGYADTVATMDADADAIQLTLAPAGAAAGRVVDRDGGPVAGASVLLASERAPLLRRQASSDAQGRFGFEEVPGGRYRLSIYADGFQRADVVGVERPPIRENASLGTITLDPARWIAGQVLAPTGLPIAGASVVVGRRGEDAVRAEADAHGRFAVRSPVAGTRVHVAADHPEWGRSWRSVLLTNVGTEVTLTLPPPARLDARVTTPDGEPVADARISLTGVSLTDASFLDAPLGDGQPEDPATRRGTTSLDGRVFWNGLGGGRYRARVEASPWAAEEVTLELTAGQTAVLTVVLDHPGAVDGRIVDSSGEAVPGAAVALAVAGPGRGDDDEALRASSDDDGRFRFADLAPGPHLVTVWHPSYRLREHAVAVEAERVHQIELVMEPAPAGRIEGTVVSASNEPIAARVGVRDLQSGRVVAAPRTTGADGQFTFEALTAGDYQVDASAVGRAGTSERTILASSADHASVRLVLTPESVIEGHVRGVGTDDLPGLVLVAHAAERLEPRSRSASHLAPDGRFRIEGLDAGAWRVVARLGTDGPTDARLVSLGVGDRVAITLDLDAGHRIDGQVRAGDLGIPNAALELMGADARQRTITDGEGRFQLLGVRAGQYTLQIRSSAGRRLDRRTLWVDDDRQLDIAIERGSLSGQVREAVSRGPVQSAVVTLTSADASWAQEVQTDARGAYRFADLAAGPYRLRVTKAGWNEGHEAVTLDADEHVRNVVLEASDEVAITVVGPDGRSPRWLEALAFEEDGRRAIAGRFTVAPDGIVRLPAPRRGAWRLHASAAGTATAVMVLEAGKPPGALVLPAAGSLEVKVPDLVLGAGVLVTVESPPGVRYLQIGAAGGGPGVVTSTFSGTAGRTTVEGLPPGTARVVATTGDGRRFAGVAWVEGAAVAAVTLAPIMP